MRGRWRSGSHEFRTLQTVTKKLASGESIVALDVAFEGEHPRTVLIAVVLYASSDFLQASVNMGLKERMASTKERFGELLLQRQVSQSGWRGDR